MKKLLLLLVLPLLMGAGCTQKTDNKDVEIEKLKKQVAALEQQADAPSEISTSTPTSTPSEGANSEEVVEKIVYKEVPYTPPTPEPELKPEPTPDPEEDESAALLQQLLEEQQRQAEEEAKKQVEAEAAELDRQIAEAKAEAARYEEGTRVMNAINSKLSSINSQANSLANDIQNIMDQYEALAEQSSTMTILEGKRARLLEDTNYYSKVAQYNSLLEQYDELSLAKSAVQNVVQYNSSLDYEIRAILSSYGITTTL